MSGYSVVMTEQAARELEAAADWWAEFRSIRQAREWYTGFSEKIAELRTSAEGLAVAAESSNFRFVLRELHFGLGTRTTHRAVFTIVGNVVVVLTVRHVAQAAITAEDIEADPMFP